MKKIFLSALSALTLTLSLSSIALEPLPDRARVLSMYTGLLLPDNSTINVDMSFDCGASFENTGLIVTSKEGAELLAAAYAYLYGEQAAEFVIDKWNNKASESDPRKPSFLIAKPSTGLSWKQSKPSLEKSRFDFSIQQASQGLEVDKVSWSGMLEAHCGTRDHKYYQQ
jgi:hypothetical protein